MRTNFIKRENASDLILIVMISALVSLLVTRSLLNLFGWPTISFGVWHIAHVLWGGVLMMIGIILILATYGKKIRRIAAIISGIGWGLFIDEIGKYLTKENDYWFQPAIIFIYISFIILFLVYRYFEKNQNKNSKMLLYSVITQLENVADKNENVDDLTIQLKKLIKKYGNKKTEKISFWQKILTKTGYYSYNKIFKRKLVLIGLSIYAGVWAINRIQETVRIFLNPQRWQLIQKIYDNYNFISRADNYMIILKIISDLIVAVLFLIGLYNIAIKKRLKGLRFFQLGLIVSIFLSSVFKLYFEQFSEVVVIATSIILFFAISKMRKEILA